MHVDLVLDQQLLGLAAPDVRLGLVVRDDRFERPAVDAAGCVDAVDRHHQADHRGLAAERCRARKRLLRADLVRRGGAEGGAPRRRHQHHRADRAAAPADERAAGELAAVPDVLRPGLVFPFFSHRKSSLSISVCSKSKRPRGRAGVEASPRSRSVNERRSRTPCSRGSCARHQAWPRAQSPHAPP